MTDLKGQKFGLLTVLFYSRQKREHPHWICKCECGNETEASSGNLRAGNVISCGCYRKALMKTLGASSLRHGHNRRVNGKTTPSRTYKTWQAMKDRCLNPNSVSYGRYGRIGITVCDRWKDSFANFLADMGERPIATTIDRINPFGNYEPSNCRWSTQLEQSNNTRRKRLLIAA